MGSDTLPDINVAPTAFDTAEADYFVAAKSDRDAAGNVRTAYPASSIVSRFTAGWGNRVDDMIRALVRAGRGETLIGTADTPETDHNAMLSWNVAGARVQLRNAANSAFRILELDSLRLGNGVRILSGTGTPEGAEIAGRGSLYTDDATGDVYRKTTTSGNTGWTALSGGLHREEFGFDSSTTTAEVYASFTSSVIEQNTSGDPRAPNIWRAPVAGTITSVNIVHESNTTSIEAQWYETNGSTTRGSAVTAAPATFTLGAGTGYQTSFAMSVSVAAGDLLCLGLNGVAAIGEANCWLEVTPS